MKHIQYVTLTRDNDYYGNPHGIVKLWLKNKTYYKEYSYESEYQAAVSLLKSLVGSDITAISQGYAFTLTELSSKNNKKNKDALKKAYIMESLGSYHLTIKEFNRYKAITREKKQ